uniref:radical SAM protein n=1 Tax=Ellagibacter isourolithinifaciens TaxID=2137581 RepID=UPI003A903713
MDVREYAKAFNQVERDYEEAVAAFGVPFEVSESCSRERRARVARACGCHCENGDGSLWRGWISPACLACRTGERTATFFIDLRCTRHCYFCFNPNQDHYEYFLSHRRDIVAELNAAHDAGAQFDCLAITGGEPLLHKEQVVAFIERARELYPAAHLRLYTCGDLLDDACLGQLAQAGLDEVRFSVKPEDIASADAPVFERMAAAVSSLPHVMVEMPVIPGTLATMKPLLSRLDAMGVRGINLLEFCFPLCNADEFRARGFELRKHPFNYLYDYWYGGGVPVAGSETEALALLE